MSNRKLIDAAERAAAERLKEREIAARGKRSRAVASGVARGIAGGVYHMMHELAQLGIEARNLDVSPRHAASPEYLRLAASGIDLRGVGRVTVGILAQPRTDGTVSVSVSVKPSDRRFSLSPDVKLVEPGAVPDRLHVNGRTVQYGEHRWELPPEADEVQYNEIGRELVNIMVGTGLGLRLV